MRDMGIGGRGWERHADFYDVCASQVGCCSLSVCGAVEMLQPSVVPGLNATQQRWRIEAKSKRRGAGHMASPVSSYFAAHVCGGHATPNSHTDPTTANLASFK